MCMMNTNACMGARSSASCNELLEQYERETHMLRGIYVVLSCMVDTLGACSKKLYKMSPGLLVPDLEPDQPLRTS